jgi:hypothetical protein
MNTLTNHIINYATGYENAFNNRVMSITSENDIISIRFRINANKGFYSLDTIKVFANATYNTTNNKITVATENSKGSRKYNSYVKYECEQLIKVFVSEAQKMVDVEIRESNRNAYDHCHVELLSMIDQTNSTHKNICYGYINQILDMYQVGASAHEMESKLIEVKTEMLSDIRLFPITETVIESTTNEQTINTYIAFDRSFSSYDEAYNYCIQSDFDSSYIQSENVSEYPLTLDLQHFASSQTTRKLYESNYDSVKIITTSGEHIARIHPSDENEYQHKIFYSSDDYVSINDTDIISVTPIYKKSIITEHGVQKWGIGKGLSLSYTIETTKKDIEVDTVEYSNIHKIECNSIQETIERLNRMQKQGWNNINIQTNVNYKNNSILTDTTDCNIEIDINTQYMDDMKKDNRHMKEQLEELCNELNDYKEFMKLYKAEKTFEQFKENKLKKNVS